MEYVKASVISNSSFFPDAMRPFDRRTVDIRMMWLECPSIARGTKPGQFVMVRCGDLTLPRPLSVHQVKDDGIALFFSVVAEGKGTAWLSERHQGDEVPIFGPMGNGFSLNTATRSVLLVAGGIGIAPLYPLAQLTAARHLKTTLLDGARTGKLLYPRQMLPAGVDSFSSTEDGTTGEKGMVTSMIRDHIGEVDQVFACGPVAMYRQMSEQKEVFGLKGKQVQVSLETVMGCGHGACYGCTITTKQGLKQVCKDGPVVDLDDISWPRFTASL